MADVLARSWEDSAACGLRHASPPPAVPLAVPAPLARDGFVKAACVVVFRPLCGAVARGARAARGRAGVVRGRRRAADRSLGRLAGPCAGRAAAPGRVGRVLWCEGRKISKSRRAW